MTHCVMSVMADAFNPIMCLCAVFALSVYRHRGSADDMTIDLTSVFFIILFKSSHYSARASPSKMFY